MGGGGACLATAHLSRSQAGKSGPSSLQAAWPRAPQNSTASEAARPFKGLGSLARSNAGFSSGFRCFWALFCQTPNIF